MIIAAVHKKTGKKIYDAETNVDMYFGNEEYQIVRASGLCDTKQIPILEGDTVLSLECNEYIDVTFSDGSFWFGSTPLTKINIKIYGVEVIS